MLAVDLHCHSTISDGLLPPATLTAKAAARGCQLFALTDHDDVSGLAVAANTAAESKMRFIPGVEISVSWNTHVLHIVGLQVDANNEDLQQGLYRLRQGRAQRAAMMAEDLEKAGLADTLAGAKRYANNPEMITRTHFARYLVEIGVARNMQAVFKRFMVQGKPGYISYQWAMLDEAINWIKSAGGEAVIAHPGRYGMGSKVMRLLLNEFKEKGGRAIEVISGCHSASDYATFAHYAQAFGLMASVGSDYHATGEGGREPGLMPDLPRNCEPIWQLWYDSMDFSI